MNTKAFIYYFIPIIILSAGLAGCSAHSGQDHNKNNGQFTEISNKKVNDQSVSNQAEQELAKRKDITKVRAVNTDKELLLAFKVLQHDRFRLIKIESQVKSGLSKKYPRYKINVSTDQKIFLEIERLEKEIKANKVDEDKLKKTLNHLKKLMKEKT
ncbi:sporulation lipoprotein YhcN/YlaJ [Scopulibacillus darangshiensis]|uniref:Sporulation lipoprotein YhcN/YlaJ n=1 Tax=Scopulibacillus darangshiensis TaxID=442528 RepID=A0A4R2PCH2_9BACL|nr:YhcN/YlaJ family sporulation lipoprotein [Scopulibacillus darangshiensis]TCP31781.1 sporulation lipoprotein YhcN/YlaJ [Scopulibacillus darangshiensis]